MPSFRLDPPKPGLTPKEYREYVKAQVATEIAHLGEDIQTINGIDMQAVRDLYNEVSPDEAFKLICLAELKMTFMKAKKATKSPVDVWNDFYERERFYREERKLPRLVIAPPTVEQEARRKEIIAKYGLEDLYATAPSDWGGPVVPRPRALVPAKRKYGLH